MSIVAIIIYWDIGNQDISFYKLAILSEKLNGIKSIYGEVLLCHILPWIRLNTTFVLFY